jgi:AcrR family transcriptional regulator
MAVTPKPPARYHHGDLKASLLDAVDEIVAAEGLEAVTLRGCAKRAGVAPSASFRHFKDKRQLLTAFATRAARRLAETMRQDETAANPNARFLAVGRAYLRFALAHPGEFRVIFRHELVDAEDEAYRAACEDLSARLADGIATVTPQDDDAARRGRKALLAWGTVHGLASLAIDGPVGRALPEGDRLQALSDTLALLGPAFRA